MNKFTLYDEQETSIPVPDLYDQPSDPVFEIDLSGEKQTLMQLISKVRNSVFKDEDQIILYCVCGKELTNNDWGDYFDYLLTLPNPIKVVYRGYLHFEAIKILTKFNDVSLDKSVKLLYIASKLHILLSELVEQPEILTGFIRYWIENLIGVDSKVIKPETLSQIGFKFTIYE